MMRSTRAGAGRAPSKEFKIKNQIRAVAFALTAMLGGSAMSSEAQTAQAISPPAAPARSEQNGAALFDGGQKNAALFDADWRFHRGGAQGAESPDFDDSGWRRLDLPHDWSIEDLPGSSSPFDPNAISQVSGGFTTGGTGWYRKSFNISESEKGKRILVQFDGF